jgi:predicted site-specific integrase-resolvase
METVSLNQAAQMLGFSPHTVKKWVDAGHIPAKVYPNGRTKMRREDVISFYNALPERAFLANHADQKLPN